MAGEGINSEYTHELSAANDDKELTPEQQDKEAVRVAFRTFAERVVFPGSVVTEAMLGPIEAEQASTYEVGSRENQAYNLLYDVYIELHKPKPNQKLLDEIQFMLEQL